MLLMTHNIKHVREEMMKKAMIALSAILVAALFCCDNTRN